MRVFNPFALELSLLYLSFSYSSSFSLQFSDPPPKRWYIYSITIVVTYLEHKSVGRHKRNSLFTTKSAAHLKDKIFPYGECLHTNIKYAAQGITCSTTQPKNMINIKCSVGSCDEFPGYNIPSE